MIAGLRRGSAAWGIFTGTMVVGASLSGVKLIGAFKVVLIARTFGAGDAIDAFLVAYLIPSFFSDLIMGSLPSALIPALIDTRQRRGPEAAGRLASGVMAGALAVLAIAAVMLWAASPAVLRLLASGFSEEKRALSRSLFYWLLPLLPLGGLSVVWRAMLNSQERFASPALAPAMTPAVTILMLLLAGQGGTVRTLIAACLAGMIMELAWLAAALHRSGFPLLPRWIGWDPVIRQVVLQNLPLMAVALIGGGNLLVDQSMAAMLGPGSVSALSYGTKLASVLAGVGASALGAAALPHFSRMIAAGEEPGIRRALHTCFRIVLVAGIPFTAILIAASGALVRTLFQGGAFTAESSQLVASIQRLSLIQLPISVLLALLLRLVSAMNANAFLVRVAIASFVVNIAGDFLLMRVLGVAGIALSNALVQLTSFILVILIVRKRLSTKDPC